MFLKSLNNFCGDHRWNIGMFIQDEIYLFIFWYTQKIKVSLVLCFPSKTVFFYWPCISTTELRNFECETENFFWNLQHMIFVFRQIWNIIEMFVSERILFSNAFSHDLTSDSGHRCIGNCCINISEAWNNFSYRSSKKNFSIEIVSWKWKSIILWTSL